jgi:hypothetical protein
LTAVSTSRPAGSEEEDDPDFSWDFSGLRDPSAMRDFISACDHCLSGYSDDGHSLDDEGYDPTHECFHVDQGDHDEDNHLDMPGNDDAPVPASRVEIPRELAVVRVPVGGSGHTARATMRDAGQARRRNGATCAAPTKHRAGVGRSSTRRRSATLGPGRPTMYN